MMNRILKRPMFRMGGRSDDGIMSIRRGYAEGDQVLPANTEEYRSQVEKEIYPSSLLGDTSRLIGNVNDALFNFGIRPLGNLANYITGQGEGINTIKPKDSVEDNIDMVLKTRGIDLDADSEEPINRIVPKEIKEKKVPQDPEKALLDVYADNKGIIDQVMGNSDEDTKRQLYLQLAKFGAGLAAQPGGDLVGAVGRAAMDPLEGVGQLLSDKRKTEKDIKMLALQKSFDDMKEPEQIKFIKAIQKEYGLGSFKEAYNLVTTSKRSPAQKLAESKAIMEFAKGRGISETGFLKEMQKLEDAGGELEDLVGVFTRQDIEILPTDIDDRVNGEYYLKDTGEPLRFVDGIIYVPGDPEFTAKIKETKKT